MEEEKGRQKVKRMGGRIELAEDLVENILVRLSVKSLIRFKCVDRSWDVLFKTPAFIINHLQIHRNQDTIMFSHTDLGKWLILNKNSKLLFTPETYYTILILKRWMVMAYPTDYAIATEFLASVLCLWNPATIEVKVVPPPPMPSRSRSYVLYFGFGAGPNSNDLKVVNLITYYKNDHPPYAVLYNLITNSWTCITIDTVPVDAIPRCFNPKGFVANGVCYWIQTGYMYEEINENLISFDFRNNQFHLLKRPPTSIGHYKDFITEVNGSTVYLVHCNYYFLDHDYKIEIWILEEDKWTKKHTVPPFKYLVDGLYAIWKGGTEFIGLHTSAPTFASFNSVSQVISDLAVSKTFLNVVHRYVESIVSLSF
ncbi:putative F-box domain, galactose oxidase/kelch, beta-propeller, F-box associated interaction [Lupinus albus]|uniref:Putative F-box domain, galactose oxidase/kelch, beta-propeller, F-box associated interaction n=1 Tax=Lupinus albus TaxID=3870 RepID=A0A6A4QH73_LUPAL|nr:putative F-box domain, galactose oxidase/kelch, beta-propeller, F-box associated interaction [Lupinus albus]